MSERYKIIIVTVLICTMGLVLFAAVRKPKPAPTPDTTEKTPEPTITTPEPVTPTYQILPVFKMEDVLKVEEEQRWDGTMTIKTDDKVLSYPYYKQFTQQYTEKLFLITPDQLNFKSERYYHTSIIKSNMPDEGKKTQSTSLEGKTLSLETKNYQIVSHEKIAPKEVVVIKDDYFYLNALNWFYSCLPNAEDSLEIGASYPLKSKDLAKIIFKEHFNEKFCTITGSGVLEEVTQSPSPSVMTARVLINLKIKQMKEDTKFNVELIGLCKISKGKTQSIELELSGPFTIIQPTFSHEGKKISSSTEGTLRIKSKISQ
ncbi:MAG: hypothetical protein QME51_02750 [Planctomycetota bacterium]|nr:hypothetical protein [Planctomycetota bacterium]MDI6787273.1 hypothetical protein [Planctomycetota bacterium]